MLNPTQLRNSLIVFCALLFFGFTFSLHIHPYRTFWNDFLVILGLVLMLGYWACLPGINIRIPGIVIVPIVFIIFIAAQTAHGLMWYAADMTFPVLYFICFAIALICGATIAMQKDGLAMLCITFAWCLAGAGLVSVVLQHIQLFDVDWMPWVVPLNWDAPVRPFANFAQPNTAALILCFSLASVWYIFLSEQIKSWAAVACGCVLLWGLALTQSRIGWLIVPIFLIVFWNEKATAIRSKRLPGAVLLMGVILYAFFVAIVPAFLHLLGGIADSVADRAGQTGVRLVLWKQALAMSIDHPWFGVGWFQFGPHQVLTATAFDPTEYSDYAHNILFNLLAETGWPLTVLLVIGTVYWVYHCCVRQWHCTQVRYLCLIFISIAVHSLVEFPLWHAFVLLPFGLMLGALHVESIGWAQLQLHKAWLAGISLVAMIAMGLIVLDYTQMSRGFDAIARIQAGDKRYLPGIQKPGFTLFPQYYDYFHIVEVPITLKMPARDVAFLERISVRFGFAPVLSRLAIVYANQKRKPEALQVLTIIQRIDTSQYADIYAQWADYARNNPGLYRAIFNAMPHPKNMQAVIDKTVTQ